MLVALRVRDFVLLESLELTLEPGFNVITGETGAGKSIIIGALGLVLGGRARADMVRPGAAEAQVEALFDVSSLLARGGALAERLTAAGIACDGELVIRRVVQRTGVSGSGASGRSNTTRTRAYLNGRLCTVSELCGLTAELADITSQHESVALTDSGRHLGYLDCFADLGGPREGLAMQVGQLKAMLEQRAQLMEQDRGRAEREALLRYQRDAIAELEPTDGEMEQLSVELARLKHANELHMTTSSVARSLEDDDESSSAPSDKALCDSLGRLAAELEAAARLDPQLEPLANELHQCWSRLRDVACDVSRYAEGIESDPDRLHEVQSRTFQLEGLLRQHGPTLADVLAAARRIDSELADLASAHTRIPELTRQIDALAAKASRAAKRLSKKRLSAATTLGEAISDELAALGMGKARVLVDVRPTDAALQDHAELSVDGARLGRDGIDRAQFLIAPNRGMAPQPLARIASGGELSRALLALKRALSRSESTADAEAGVQVFDEVDAGVGGATADKIGQAISSIAARRQVLCITHLAAIAAYADAHYVVSKHDGASIASSAIRRVAGKERTAEVARMLTGERLTRASLRAAGELIAATRMLTDAAE